MSQGIRYRRIISIINNDSILRSRLIELKSFFLRSGYPEGLVNSILDSVPDRPRCLDIVKSKNEKDFITPWIVTYGPGFDEAKRVEKDVNELLSLSETWKDVEGKKIVQVIPRRAPNLKDLLFRRKALALDPEEQSGIVECNVKNCQTCRLVDSTASLNCGTENVNVANGSCKSWNVVYCFQCKLCNMKYVGKTTDSLNHRVNGHRSKFYKVLRQRATNELGAGMDQYDDEQIVGAHLVLEHNISRRRDFNNSYNIFILSHPRPTFLRITEQFWIDKLRTLRPFGLNQSCSVGES